MIIELFGPAGVGKTTLAHALSSRLRDRGHHAEVVLTYRPGEYPSMLGGLVPALRRVSRALGEIIALAARPFANAQEFATTASLVRRLPPRNIVWFMRFSQYILRLSHVWRKSAQSDRIIIFDQAYVQAICSLALFNRSATEGALAAALKAAPASDLIIRLTAPEGVLRARLSERLKRETTAERLFEANLQTNLQSVPIVESIDDLLQARGEKILRIDAVDDHSLPAAVDRVEREILARLAACQKRHAHMHAAAAPCAEPAAADAAAVEATAEPSDLGLTKAFTHASIWAFAIYVGGAGLTCLAQLLIARLIGAPNYGIYSYVLAWVTLLSYAASLGLHMALLRFIPAYTTTGQWPLARGIISFAIRTTCVSAVLIALSGAAFILMHHQGLNQEVTVDLLIGMAIVPLMALYTIMAAIVRTFGGVVSALLPERIVRDGVMLTLVAIVAKLTTYTADATAVLAALLVSSAAALVMVAFSARALWPRALRAVSPRFATQDWWKLALPIMIIMAVDIVMTRAGVMLLGWSGNSREAGVFALGSNLAMLIMLPRVAVGTFFSPIVSGLHARGDNAALQSMFSKATLLSLAGALILSLPVLVLTAPLLRLFGPDFAPAAPIAQILVVGQLLAAAWGPQQNLLTMTGHERPAALMMTVSAAATFAGCALAIPHYGGIGAAAVTAVIQVAWNIAMAVHIYRRLKLNSGLAAASDELRRLKAIRSSARRANAFDDA